MQKNFQQFYWKSGSPSREDSLSLTCFSCPRSFAQQKRHKMRVSIFKATHPPPHASLLKRKVEKEKRGKKYRAVKRTNLPSTRTVESLAASIFSWIFSFFLFYVLNRERFYLLSNESRSLFLMRQRTC